MQLGESNAVLSNISMEFYIIIIIIIIITIIIIIDVGLWSFVSEVTHM